VSVEEVAAHLGVARESVYRWVESRDLPAHRVGRLLRFRLSEVDGWVQGRRTDARGTRVAEPRAAYGTSTAPAADAAIPAIDEMVRIIVERFDPERIVLFGSHARGHAGPDSDVDLLVILEFEGSKREKQVEIGVALHDIKVPKDIVVSTPEEIARYGHLVGTVLYPALREGTVLYERSAG
jgi:excisionase family DNA binding protein